MVIAVLVECQMHDYQTGDEDDGDEADGDGDDDYCNDVIRSRHSIYSSLASEDSSVKSK